MKICNELGFALSGIVCAISLCAYSAEFQNARLVNDGFENGLTGWGSPSKEWSVAPGQGREKSSALVWRAGKTGSVPMQRLAIQGGMKYRFGAYVRVVPYNPNGLPKITLRCYDWQEKLRCEVVATPSGDNDPNAEGWVRYEGIAAPPTDPYCDLLVEMPPEAKGCVYFDDFYYQIDGGKTVGEMISGSYRNEAASGKVRFAVALNVNTVRYPLSTLKPVFSFEGEDGKRFVIAPDSFSYDKALVSIEVACLKRGASRVEFSLGRSGAPALGTSSLEFRRLASPASRRVTFDEYNRTIVDGKPFFPLGMFIDKVTKEEMAVYRQGPFNCVHPYTVSKEGLDICHDTGLMCIGTLIFHAPGRHWRGRGRITPEKALANTLTFVDSLKNHPALLAWYTIDEDQLAYLSTQKKNHDEIWRIDPDHPIYAALDRPEHVRAFAGVFDVIGMDPYPIGNNRGGIETAFGWGSAANEAMYAMRPMWQIPQAYNWGWHSSRKNQIGKNPELRFPTREEFRSMMWQAIAAGANGLLPYGFFEIRRNMKGAERDATWKMVCEESQKVRDRFHVLLSPPGPAIEGLPAGLAARTWNVEGRTWALVCNLTRKKIKGSFRIGGRTVSADLSPIGVKLSPIDE